MKIALTMLKVTTTLGWYPALKKMSLFKVPLKYQDIQTNEKKSTALRNKSNQRAYGG